MGTFGQFTERRKMSSKIRYNGPKSNTLLVVGIILLLGSLGLFLLLVTGGCGPPPTFYTAHGTAVYTNNISGITEEKVWRALEFFAVSFPELIEEVSEEDIRDILRRTILEWKPKPFKCWRHDLNDWGQCAGTQLGYQLTVKWTGHIHNCALFHELTHEVMEFIMNIIDYEHSWKEWWDAVETLKHRYSELGIE